MVPKEKLLLALLVFNDVELPKTFDVCASGTVLAASPPNTFLSLLGLDVDEVKLNELLVVPVDEFVGAEKLEEVVVPNTSGPPRDPPKFDPPKFDSPNIINKCVRVLFNSIIKSLTKVTSLDRSIEDLLQMVAVQRKKSEQKQTISLIIWCSNSRLEQVSLFLYS